MSLKLDGTEAFSIEYEASGTLRKLDGTESILDEFLLAMLGHLLV